jgi:hypothetical protein
VGRPFHFSSPPGTALLSRGHGNFSARAARSPAPRTGRYASGRKHPPRPSRTIGPHPRPKYQRCTKHGRAPAGRSFGQPPWHCGSSLCRTRNKKGGPQAPRSRILDPDRFMATRWSRSSCERAQQGEQQDARVDGRGHQSRTVFA